MSMPMMQKTAGVMINGIMVMLVSGGSGGPLKML